MASRRNLKKAIHYILYDLSRECCVNYLLTPEFKEKQFTELTERIEKVDNDFVARVNHTDANGNAKLVKVYYKKLLEDFNKEISAIVDDIVKLTKNNSK